jgi:phosphatidylserine/phosphatidylglycerophosphate/cardiolipin synthase-like enzyme
VGEQLVQLESDGKLATVSLKDGRLHTKLILIDNRTVIAGSKNWSDLGAATKANDVLVVEDTKGGIIEACMLGFLSAGKGAGFAPPVRLRRKGVSSLKDRCAVMAHMTRPGPTARAARQHLMALLAGARRRVYVAMFLFTDPELAGAVAACAARGVEVRVVIDATQRTNFERRTDRHAVTVKRHLAALKTTGALRTSGTAQQLHHKFAIIDDAVVTGSANWSRAAFDTNVEVLVTLLPAKRRDVPAVLIGHLGQHAKTWEAAR